MSAQMVYGPEDTAAPFSCPSPAIWGGFPSNLALADDPSIGFLFHEDFRAFPKNATNTTLPVMNWNVFLSDGATMLSAGIANRSAINLLSDGDNEGAIFVLGSASIQVTRGSKRKVAFETRFKSSTIADTKHGIFAGLHEDLIPTATSVLAADGTLTDENFIGFHRLEGDGDKIDIVYKADGQTQQSFTDALTLVADTFVKVGFYFDGDDTLKFYLNGAEYTTARLGATALTAATFPSDVNLTPVFGMLNATASSPGSATFDWIRFGWTAADADGYA